MVHHHIKYKEIHGVDEVVLMDKGEHHRLHCRLRREGKCGIQPGILARVSMQANSRRRGITSTTLDMDAIKPTRTIHISGEVEQRLSARGKFGENYNDVLNRILDELESLKKKKDR